MSNEFTFFRPGAVNIAIGEFAALLSAGLTKIGKADLLDPYRDDYRVRSAGNGELAIEVDLHLAPGAVVKVAAPFACDADRMTAGVDKLVDRIGALLDGLDATIELRDTVDRKARAMMRRAAKAGIDGRVVDVRLGTIGLVWPAANRKVEVVVEGAACHMLRPFHATWRIDDIDDLDQEFEWFRAAQQDRDAKRRAAVAIGAVGYIDALALALVDGHAEDRRATLREAARRLETQWYVERPDERPEGFGLTWWDGVLRPCGDLSDRISLSVEDVFVQGLELDGTAVGRRLGEFVEHHGLDDLVIREVVERSRNLAQVRLDSPVFAFTAAGEVIN